jgi:hypothetical protein
MSDTTTTAQPTNTNSAGVLGSEPIVARGSGSLSSLIVPRTENRFSAMPQIDVAALNQEQAAKAMQSALEGKSLQKVMPSDLKKQIGEPAYNVVVQCLAKAGVKFKEGTPIGVTLMEYGQKLGTNAALAEIQKVVPKETLTLLAGGAIATDIAVTGLQRGGNAALTETAQWAKTLGLSASIDVVKDTTQSGSPEKTSFKVSLTPNPGPNGELIKLAADGKWEFTNPAKNAVGITQAQVTGHAETTVGTNGLTNSSANLGASFQANIGGGTSVRAAGDINTNGNWSVQAAIRQNFSDTTFAEVGVSVKHTNATGTERSYSASLTSGSASLALTRNERDNGQPDNRIEGRVRLGSF